MDNKCGISIKNMSTNEIEGIYSGGRESDNPNATPLSPIAISISKAIITGLITGGATWIGSYLGSAAFKCRD